MRRRRTSPLLPVVFTALAMCACNGGNNVSVTVLTPPDADPWMGPDAANWAVITMIGGTSQRVPVINGSFSFQMPPANPTQSQRLEVQAERGTQVLGTGITPLIDWGSGGHDVVVLVQPADSVVSAPGGGLSSPRGAPEVVAQFPGFFVVNADGDAGAGQTPTGYDTIGNVPISLSQTVPSWCDNHCMIMPISGGWLLLRGQPPGTNCTMTEPQEVFYDGNGSTGTSASSLIPVPFRRCDYDDSTVVVDTVHPSGAWLVGGQHRGGTVTDASGETTTLSGRLRDVDRFTSTDATNLDEQAFVTQSTDPMMRTQLVAARLAPQVVVLSPPSSDPTEPIHTEWIVGGGQDLTLSPRPPLLEIFDPADPQGRAAVTLAPDALNDRDQIALVCAAFDSPSGNCNVVLALGGADPTGAVVNDDLVIDGQCLLGPNCTAPLLWHGPLLHHPRRGARVAYAEGGSIVVAGGYDATGPVYDIESIDVSAVSMTVLPMPGHVVYTLQPPTQCANPGLVALDNGTVAIVGGVTPDGASCGEILFYRR